MKSHSTLLVLALVSFLTTAGSALFHLSQTEQLSARESHASAQQNAELMATELDNAIHHYQRSLRAYAQLPQLQGFSPESYRNPELYRLLQLLCESLDGALCYLLDAEGKVRAVNLGTGGAGLHGKSMAFRPYFQQAKLQGDAVYLARGVHTGERGVYFAQRLSNQQGSTSAVIVVKIMPEVLGLDFEQREGRALLVSPDQLIFASNDPSWLMKSLQPLSQEAHNRLRESRQFGSIQGEVGLKTVDGHVQDGENRFYFVGSAEVARLRGWQTRYLIDETHGHLYASDNLISYLLSALSLVVLVVLVLFYRASIRDQRSRAVAEAALRESETRLRRLSQISSEAIIIHSRGQILDANNAAETLFGYTLTELRAQSDIWQLLAPQSRGEAQCRERQDFKRAYEVVGKHASGATLPLEITAKQAFMGGEPVRVACFRNISQRKEQEAHIRHLALYDNLTQLPNRHSLLHQLNEALRLADQSHRTVHLMFVDLDDFKKVNDSQGHSAGDHLLVSVAARMQTLLEADETLARYGGDEFLLLLQNRSEQRVTELADAILELLQQPFALDAGTFYISASIGIAAYPHDAVSATELLSHADTAMYASKAAGRNSWHLFRDEMNTAVSEQLQMEQQLRQALERDELYIEYQPVFFAGDQNIIAAESLLRWHNPELGFVGPDRFIPLAEQTGMIEPIGRWVMEQACIQAARWRQQGLNPFYISVNLSPRQLRDTTLVPFVTDLLERTGLPASALVIEVTEGVLIHDDEGSTGMINALAALGVGLAMDDFGTGYSSLSYLKRFPFNTLKIDREFVREIDQNTSDQKLVVATVAMAEAMGLRVVAEGVENEIQRQFLADNGVRYLQGFLLSRPISPAQFEARFIDDPAGESGGGKALLAHAE